MERVCAVAWMLPLLGRDATLHQAGEGWERAAALDSL